MLIIGATINKIMSLHDRGWRLILDTQELNQTERDEFNKLSVDQFGWFAFDSEPFGQEAVKELEQALPDIPDVVIEKESKSPSQRLRSALYVYYSQLPPDKKRDPFEVYYLRYMDILINKIKSKLKPNE